MRSIPFYVLGFPSWVPLCFFCFSFPFVLHVHCWNEVAWPKPDSSTPRRAPRLGTMIKLYQTLLGDSILFCFPTFFSLLPLLPLLPCSLHLCFSFFSCFLLCLLFSSSVKLPHLLERYMEAPMKNIQRINTLSESGMCFELAVCLVLIYVLLEG